MYGKFRMKCLTYSECAVSVDSSGNIGLKNLKCDKRYLNILTVIIRQCPTLFTNCSDCYYKELEIGCPCYKWLNESNGASFVSLM